MSRVMVTGGAGFLGSHLCDRLIAQGHDVICLDNFLTGNRRNISQHLGHPRFQLVTHDVVEPFHGDVDQIYNLACPASPVHYQADPVNTLKTCVLGTLHALELARKTGAKVLQASTSEVYGDPLVHPQVEAYPGNVNPIGPRGCYDEGKRCAETLCFDFHRQHQVPVKVVRIFNTYGPRMAVDDGRVISNFIVQALRGQNITIQGDGRQTRSFCHVDDLVTGLLTMMQTDTHVTGPINLGNPTEVTILELADTIKAMTGSQSAIEFRPQAADDPKQRRPDITRASTTLGWRPNVDLTTGLNATIAHFRQALKDS